MTRPSSEIAADLAAAEVGAHILRGEINAARAEIRAIECRVKVLVSAEWDLIDARIGQIATIRRELAAAQRREADSALPRVHARRLGPDGAPTGDPVAYALIRITPTYVAARIPGHEGEERWRRPPGGPPTRGGWILIDGPEPEPALPLGGVRE